MLMALAERRDALYMLLKIILLKVIWLVDDLWRLELLDQGRRPIYHDHIFASCKFQMEKRSLSNAPPS